MRSSGGAAVIGVFSTVCVFFALAEGVSGLWSEPSQRRTDWITALILLGAAIAVPVVVARRSGR